MALFGDANLQNQYDSIRSQLQNTGAYTPMTMPEQTLDGITEQLAQIYRPQVERAIAQRYGATKQQKAAIDVDAGSRGMGTSSFVTDAKNRIMNAEASDIAGLESDYASQLAGDALSQYQNYLSDKLRLDQYNQQLQAAMEGDVYDRTMQQYQQGMIAGTLPYQQLQLLWQQQQNAASGGGGGGVRHDQFYLGNDGIWYTSQDEAEKANKSYEAVKEGTEAVSGIKAKLFGGIKLLQK